MSCDPSVDNEEVAKLAAYAASYRQLADINGRHREQIEGLFDVKYKQEFLIKRLYYVATWSLLANLVLMVALVAGK